MNIPSRKESTMSAMYSEIRGMIHRVKDKDGIRQSGEQESSTSGARGAYEKVRGRTSEALQTIERFIATKPELCLGVALCFGVVTGWIIKRRT